MARRGAQLPRGRHSVLVRGHVTVLDHHALGLVWIAVNTDLTARRQAQEAQAALASIVQASHEAILAKTLEGIVTSWNPGAERLFGYTAAEMIGGPIEVLIPVDGKDEESGLRARVAQPSGSERSSWRPPGTRRWRRRA